jgi:hypothetical protein
VVGGSATTVTATSHERSAEQPDRAERHRGGLGRRGGHARARTDPDKRGVLVPEPDVYAEGEWFGSVNANEPNAWARIVQLVV